MMNSLKIYVHTSALPAQCGVMRFLNRLMEELRLQGVNVTTNFQEQDITHMLNVIIENENIISECRKRNIQIISRFSEVNIHYYNGLKLSYDNADKIIFQSHSNQVSFRSEFGEKNVPEIIIKNGINYNEFSKINKQKTKNIFSLGAFHKREKCSHVKKNKILEYILNALIPLFKQDPEWKYYILGPGSHHNDLQKYLDLPCFKDRLFFLGRIY